MSILGRKLALIALLAPLFAFGQGSQLPKYTVATLPGASTHPHYIVQVIDGASSTDCITGGGAQNVACVNVAGVWHALGTVSPTFTGTVTVNSMPTYSVHIGPLGTMTASWNLDTTTAATACASLGCSTGGGTGNTATTPAWLQYLGTGADGSCVVGTSCNGSSSSYLAAGSEYYYTTFTVPYGTTFYGGGASGNAGVVVHATGACTIAGTITDSFSYMCSGATNGYIGGPGGGGGGGTNAGNGGNVSVPVGVYGAANNLNYATVQGGTAGSSSGGNGSIPSGNTTVGILGNTAISRMAVINAGATDGVFMSGAKGGSGGSSGGTSTTAGGGVALICGSIVGTDGTHTGVIDVSGGYGNPPTGNSEGAAGGSGGGAVILSSQSSVSTWPAVYYDGGPGGLCTVPQALGTGGTCTTQPKLTLGVTSGALNGTATVVQAGAGCGTGTGVVWNVVGGGGTLGTGTINATWSSGAVASATVTPGTSSGYTAATYTTCGTGGDGYHGLLAEFQGW